MKNVLKASILFVSVLLSCGGSDTNSESIEPIMITPKTTKISGALGKYFTVVDGKHKYKPEKYFGGILTISIKRNNKDFDFDPKYINPFGSRGSEKYHGGVGITIFDETSPILVNSATSEGTSGVYSHEDIVSLFNLDKGEIAYVRWSYDKDEFKDAKTFKITSAFKESDGFKNNNSYSDNSTYDETSNSNNWDEVLDDYESYFKEYKKLYKQAMDGDANALSSYMDILNDANDLASSLESASGELTAKQRKRLLKIQSDILKVY